jgi:hypothetical protein
MKSLSYIFLLLLAISFFGCSGLEDLSETPIQSPLIPETININTFGGSNNESAQSVVATNDGGYAVLGYTQSNDLDITDKLDTSFDFWLLKYDAQNNIQWQKTYGGSLDERGRNIIQTQDGGFAIIGSSQSTDGDLTDNNGGQDFWLAKLDAQGNIEWQEVFGFSGNDTGISVLQTSDLGYLLTGVLDVTASGGQGNTGRVLERHAGGDYWAIKVDSSGSLEWSRYFGGNFTDTPEGAVESEQGDFIIAGGSDSADTDITNNKGTYDFWVIKIASNGDFIWEKSFGGDQIDEARAIIKSNDGNFVIAGDTRSDNTDVSGNNGAADMWFIKINTDGELLWQKTLGGTSFDVSRDIKLTQDNGLILTGSSRSSDGDVSENKGQNDAWIVKIDSNGDLEWEISAGGSNIDFAYGVAQLNDRSIVAVGDTTSDDGDIIENKGFSDLLVIKIN